MPLNGRSSDTALGEAGFGAHLLQLLLTGIGAGLIAAVVLTVLQTMTTTPLILAAEVFERGDAGTAVVTEIHGHSAHARHGADHAEGDSAAPPRLAGTAVANAAIAIGFGMILAVVATNLLPTVGVSQGLALGGAGFVSAALAPALGLPPALPGSAEIPLEPRQLWWLCAVLSTAIGLLVLWRGGKLRWFGILAVAFPHVLGAPTAPIEHGLIPAALASRFVAASLVDAAVLWLVLGASVGWLLGRTGSQT